MIRFQAHKRILRGVAQLVARLVRDQEVAGSNPAAPILYGQVTSGRPEIY
jgi:hypothetical protein